MLTVKDGEKIARKLGCQPEERRNHRRVNLKVEGVIVGSYGWTRSGGKKEDKSTSYIAKQIHLTPRQAKNLADCPLSVEEYAKILREKGALHLYPGIEAAPADAHTYTPALITIFGEAWPDRLKRSRNRR
jgi:hypothetical protein